MEEITNTSQGIWTFGNNLFQNGLFLFLIHAGLIFLAAKIVVHLLRRGLEHQSRREDTSNQLILQYLAKTIKTIVYILCAFSVLSDIIPLKGLGNLAVGSASILAVAVSLAAQETFGNYIAGFFVALYHPFKVGDNISLPEKNIAGTVTGISLRHTTLTTVENTQIMIPNSMMNSCILENRTFGQTDYTHYELIGVAYDSDIDAVKEAICHVLANTPGIIDGRTDKSEPFVPVQVNAFQDSAIEIKFPIHVESFGAYFTVAPIVRECILKEFNQRGIEIPYPIVTVERK